MGETTTIQIDRETWKRLNSRKEPGDGFDDVVRRLLEDSEAAQRDEGVKGDGVPVVGAGDGQVATDEAVPVADVAAVTVPGGGETAERRRAAVSAVYERLREGGRASKAELLAVAVEIAGDTYETEESLWKNCVSPALRELEGVSAEGPSGYWRVQS